MRFLHTSDWHLGRLFHNVDLIDDQRHVLEQFIEVVRSASLDAVFISGDIYDRTVPPTSAVRLLDEVLSTLVLDIKVPTVIIPGNHDSVERLGFGSRLLRDKGLYIAGGLSSTTDPITFDDKFGQVQVVSIPFATPAALRNWAGIGEIKSHEQTMSFLTSLARENLGGGRSIVLAHAFVTGGIESDSERSLSVGGSEQVHASVFEGFDYVALGHLHRPQQVEERVRYSGSLLKYSFSERDHEKSLSLVEMDKQGSVVVEEVKLTPRREVRAVEGSLEEVLAAGLTDSNRDDYILAILSDTTPLLNPMARLRERYPHVLHIERPHFGVASASGISVREHRKMTPMALFEAFWLQTCSEELSQKQRDVFVEAMDRVEGDHR